MLSSRRDSLVENSSFWEKMPPPVHYQEHVPCIRAPVRKDPDKDILSLLAPVIPDVFLPDEIVKKESIAANNLIGRYGGTAGKAITLSSTEATVYTLFDPIVPDIFLPNSWLLCRDVKNIFK